ncbi:hypothetical protein C0J52_03789 [Blattella germanica]|nr:hypothetical protein C0J52_03789 [Blattella germanica]
MLQSIKDDQELKIPEQQWHQGDLDQTLNSAEESPPIDNDNQVPLVMSRTDTETRAATIGFHQLLTHEEWFPVWMDDIRRVVREEALDDLEWKGREEWRKKIQI